MAVMNVFSMQSGYPPNITMRSTSRGFTTKPGVDGNTERAQRVYLQASAHSPVQQRILRRIFWLHCRAQIDNTQTGSPHCRMQLLMLTITQQG